MRAWPALHCPVRPSESPFVAVGPPADDLTLRAATAPAVRASDLLNLEQARRPGLAARQPGGDPNALPAFDPAQLDHAPGGIGDQLLGHLVAAHRARLHAPHDAAATNRLLARRQSVNGDR